MSVNELKIAQTTDNITKLVQQAHPHMVYRELQQNAIEAVGEAGSIEWCCWSVETSTGELVDKLAIVSRGVGMDYEELRKSINTIGHSGGSKKVAFDQNFGQGAKVTLLKSYKLGAKYISCKGGVVTEAWLRQSETGKYGLVSWPGDDGKFYDVQDVTDEYAFKTDQDWVAVVIMGDSETHDTFLYPQIDGEQKKDKNYWLCQHLNQRLLPNAKNTRSSRQF